MHAVNTFSICGLNFRMQKYAQCGPRLTKNHFFQGLLAGMVTINLCEFYLL